jgi:uncharacterized LabA/DUF88 family protein
MTDRQIGVFVDTSNLYLDVRRKFKNRKVDYNKYLTICKDIGEVVAMTAYGVQAARQASPFIHCMRQIGFGVKLKQPPVVRPGDEPSQHKDVTWDVGITTDILRALHKGKINTVMLGSSDSSFTPLLRHLKDVEVPTIVFACNIPRSVTSLATTTLEINSTHLLDYK